MYSCVTRYARAPFSFHHLLSSGSKKRQTNGYVGNLFGPLVSKLPAVPAYGAAYIIWYSKNLLFQLIPFNAFARPAPCPETPPHKWLRLNI